MNQKKQSSEISAFCLMKYSLLNTFFFTIPSNSTKYIVHNDRQMIKSALLEDFIKHKPLYF